MAKKSDAETTKFTKAYLTYVLMPLWIAPGFADYLFHRRTKIQETSGWRESLLHNLMMGAIGAPALAGLLCEINAGLLASFAGSFVLHELLTIWDVGYAYGRREVSPAEQHAHSFLEVLPFTTLSFTLVMHWDQALALAGMGPEPPRFGLEPKREPLPPAYVATLLGAIAAFIAIPYAEELVRCLTYDKNRG